MNKDGNRWLANFKNATKLATAIRKPPVAAGWNRTNTFTPLYFNSSFLAYRNVLSNNTPSVDTNDSDSVEYRIYGTKNGSPNLYSGDDGVIYLKIRRLGDIINEISANLVVPFIPFFSNPNNSDFYNQPYARCITPVKTLGNVNYEDLAENFLAGEYDDYYVVTSANWYFGSAPRQLFTNGYSFACEVYPCTFYNWRTIFTNQKTVDGNGEYNISAGIRYGYMTSVTEQANSFGTHGMLNGDFMTQNGRNDDGLYIGNGVEIDTPYKQLLIGKFDMDGNFNRGVIFGDTSVSCDFRYSTTMFHSLIWNTTGVAFVACAFPSIQSIIDYYNDWGFRATTDLDEAINSDNPDSGYIPPGVPTTPPVVESFPDNSSDTVEFPKVNITANTLTGCMVYNYSSALEVLKWLKSNTFFNDINRLFSNPLEAVYSFLLYPFDIVNHDSNNVEPSTITSILNVSTDIPNYLIKNGYNFIIDGGEYFYMPYYGNFADYAFVDYSLYIPFCGIVSLNPDDVVNKTLSIKYALNISSGEATVFLLSDGQLLRIFTASLAQSIPIIASNNNERILNITLSALGNIGNVGKGIATSVATQNPLPALSSVGEGILDTGKTILENPYRQTITGKLGVDTAIYAPYDCYLIIDNHYYSPPSQQSQLQGVPSISGTTINDLTGYFSVKSVDITSTTATVSELSEIEQILKSGVYRS